MGIQAVQTYSVQTYFLFKNLFGAILGPFFELEIWEFKQFRHMSFSRILMGPFLRPFLGEFFISLNCHPGVRRHQGEVRPPAVADPGVLPLPAHLLPPARPLHPPRLQGARERRGEGAPPPHGDRQHLPGGLQLLRARHPALRRQGERQTVPGRQFNRLFALRAFLGDFLSWQYTGLGGHLF